MSINHALDAAYQLGKSLTIRNRIEAVAQLPWREQPEALFFVAFDSLPISAQRKLCAAFGGSVIEITERRTLAYGDPAAWEDGDLPQLKYETTYSYRAIREDMRGEIETTEEEYDALRILAESLYADFAVGMTVKLRELRATEGA
jgi:hypothetical protein